MGHCLHKVSDLKIVFVGPKRYVLRIIKSKMGQGSPTL